MSDNDNMDTMISSLITKNRDEFNNAFSSEMGERIGEIVANKKLEISNDVLSDEQEVDEKEDQEVQD